MAGGRTYAGVIFVVISIVILFSTFIGKWGGGEALAVEEEVADPRTYGGVITEGSSLTVLTPEIADFSNNAGIIEVHPPLPEGVVIFQNNWSMGEKTLDAYEGDLCIISMNGGIGCIDSNEIDGTVDWHYPPIENSVFSSVSVGGNHVCGILELHEGSEIYCWGSNTNGQLGNHSDFFSEGGVLVSNPEGLVWNSVATGETHTCASTSENSVYCWGMGALGQIGNEKLDDSIFPTEIFVNDDSEILSLEAGQNHNCVLFSANVVECWGWNGWSQIGDGTFEDRMVPTGINISSEGEITKLFLGPRSTCILSEKSEVFCWGENSNGQISDDLGDSVSVSREIIFSGQIRSLLIGDEEICILSEEGNVICDRVKNTPLFSLKGVARISEFGSHMCFVSGDGMVSCHNWDDGARDELVHWKIGLAEIPVKLSAGQISGVPVQNYNGMHNVFYNGTESLNFEVIIFSSRKNFAYGWGPNSIGSRVRS